MTIRSDLNQHVLTLTIDRPEKKNAFTNQMYLQMHQALAQAQSDNDVWIVSISGAGGCFSAGNDLADFVNAPLTEEHAPVFKLLKTIAGFSKPIVAKVEGLAVGIGTTLLLHCDLIYCAATTKFSMPFTKLGVCPEAGSSLLLPRIMGYPRAAELLLFGDTFSADQAYDFGLVTKVLPDEELEAYTQQQIAKLLQLPQTSLQITKRLMKAETADNTQKVIDIEGKEFMRMVHEPNAKEAFAAFFEKRLPQFNR